MKKILFLLFALIITTSIAFCADMRFVQVDSAMFSASDENPATVMIGNKKQPISLVSWKKLSPLSCVFYFNHIFHFFI